MRERPDLETLMAYGDDDLVMELKGKGATEEELKGIDRAMEAVEAALVKLGQARFRKGTTEVFVTGVTEDEITLVEREGDPQEIFGEEEMMGIVGLIQDNARDLLWDFDVHGDLWIEGNGK
jgi:hypothetical protein